MWQTSWQVLCFYDQHIKYGTTKGGTLSSISVHFYLTLPLKNYVSVIQNGFLLKCHEMAGNPQRKHCIVGTGSRPQYHRMYHIVDIRQFPASHGNLWNETSHFWWIFMFQCNSIMIHMEKWKLYWMFHGPANALGMNEKSISTEKNYELFSESFQ